MMRNTYILHEKRSGGRVGGVCGTLVKGKVGEKVLFEVVRLNTDGVCYYVDIF